MSTIPLAKGYSEKHLEFPVMLSQKIDGVPIRIDIYADGRHTIRTRQGKDMPSVRRLVQEFVDEFLCNRILRYVNTPCVLIGEVHQTANPWADFKDTSGIVRRQDDQSHLLSIALFEMFTPALQEVGFRARFEAMQMVSGLHEHVYVVYQHTASTVEELQDHFDQFCVSFPKAEGMVARNWNDPFMPGKRSWGYQKLLREPTIDLRIVGVEEAIDKDGNPKGMAGRLIASYNGEQIGIGPGRLTHEERIKLWRGFKETGRKTTCFPNRIAQIKYKKDDSYAALRQPTFQFWRDDKDTPDA